MRFHAEIMDLHKIARDCRHEKYHGRKDFTLPHDVDAKFDECVQVMENGFWSIKKKIVSHYRIRQRQ